MLFLTTHVKFKATTLSPELFLVNSMADGRYKFFFFILFDGQYNVAVYFWSMVCTIYLWPSSRING